MAELRFRQPQPSPTFEKNFSVLFTNKYCILKTVVSYCQCSLQFYALTIKRATRTIKSHCLLTKGAQSVEVTLALHVKIAYRTVL